MSFPVKFSFSVLKPIATMVFTHSDSFSSSRNAAVRNKGMLVTMDPVILRLIAIGKVDVSQIIGDWEDGVRLVFDY